MEINEKMWICNNINLYQAEKISKELGISILIAKVFLNRGISDINEIRKFLDTDIKNLLNPFKLKDLEISVDRIIKAINDSETILIYGDYDVDGVTSTVILVDFLRKYSKKVIYYLPDREKEGYGITIKSLENMFKSIGSDIPNLIITVDCGITSFEEIEYINSKGIDIIVTDHHQLDGEIPKAYAVINPQRSDCSYPFKKLAGVGIAFKLINGLCLKLNLGDLHLEYLDLVALGTVADVVPIIDENRIIVGNGIDKMVKTKNLGLKRLMDVSKVLDKKMTTYTIAFLIAPKINAAGRIGDANRAVELFLTNDNQKAILLADELSKENKFRQIEELSIIEEAVNIVERDDKFRKNRILVLAKEGWHPGIIGIVASKIVEKYYKPCIIFSINKSECKGSARSIEGFNIHEAISFCKELTLKFGGHEQAAGLTIPTANLEEFDRKINQYAMKNLSDNLLIQKLRVDVEVTKSDINIESVKELIKMEPFGFMNPAPVFLYSGLSIANIKLIGNDKHLKITFRDDKLLIDSVAFNIGHMKKKIESLKKFDIICSMDINCWNGSEKVQLNLKDFKECTENINRFDYFSSLDRLILDVEIDNNGDNIVKTRNCNHDSNLIKEIIGKRNVLIIVNCFNCLKKVKSMLKWSIISGIYGINYSYLTNTDLYCTIIVNPFPDDENLLNYEEIVFYGCRLSKSYYNKINNTLSNKLKLYDNEDCTEFKDIYKIDRTLMGTIYKLLKHKKDGQGKIMINSVFDYINDLSDNKLMDINYVKFKNGVRILDELNLINIKKDDEDTMDVYMDVSNNGKKDLESSELFIKLNNL